MMPGDSPPLDVQCDRCCGQGMVRDPSGGHGGIVACLECKGKGCIPTDFGKAILRFVEVHLKVSVNLET